MGVFGALKSAVKAPVKAVKKLPGMGAVGNAAAKVPGVGMMGRGLGLGPSTPPAPPMQGPPQLNVGGQAPPNFGNAGAPGGGNPSAWSTLVQNAGGMGMARPVPPQGPPSVGQMNGSPLDQGPSMPQVMGQQQAADPQQEMMRRKMMMGRGIGPSFASSRQA